MYKVIKTFADVTDNLHDYAVGDQYPREGLSPSAERITELSTDANAMGTPLIAEDEPKPAPKRRTAKKV